MAVASNGMEFVARRQFAPLYIWLDLAFLALYAAMLLWRKHYMTVLIGVLAGILYFAVDFGIFNLALHTRSISGNASLFWVLLWMSMSYGFTNFTWIWLWLQKDSRLVEWSTLIFGWWFCAPIITQTITTKFLPQQAAHPITIQRTTGAYHGWMAIILFAGYTLAIIWNLRQPDRQKAKATQTRQASTRINIPWLLACGILIQFAWELALLLGGIRSAGLDFSQAIKPLVINSLLETNLGMPYVYLIFLAVSARWTEQFTRVEPQRTLLQTLEYNNSLPMPKGS